MSLKSMVLAFNLSPVWVSLKIASIATIITFFLGIITARLLLNYQGKIKGIIDGILITPLVLPPTVIGFLLLLIFGKNSPIGQFLHQLGINIIFTWQAAVLTATVVSFPLMYRTSLGAFEQIEPNLLRAARTLGASEWVVFWQVILPLSFRGIVAATILSFARALGEFGATLMLAGNIPQQTQTLPIAIFSAVEAGDMQEAFILVGITLAISLTVIMSINFQAEGNRPFKVKRKLSSSVTTQPVTTGLSVNLEKHLPNFTLTINLTAQQETLGILGMSGSGKSMTLNCLAGLMQPDQGQIILNGRVLFDAAKKINLPTSERCIGFVFQNYALFPHLTVQENIAFGLQKLPLAEQKRRICHYIAQMQLYGLEDRYPAQLSGGQQQRVALARALAIEPEALLLDEPLSSLDTQLRGEIEKQLLETLSNYHGVTLFVSHNLEEVYRLCQNILVLSQGKILTYGDKAAIFSQPGSYKVARLTGCQNISSVKVLSANQLEAIDWGCQVNITQPIPPSLSHIAIHSHYLLFKELSPSPSSLNSFPCWLVQIIHTPHRVTLYLHLHHPPTDTHNYHIQVELLKDSWHLLQSFTPPWHLSFLSEHLLFLWDDS